MKLVHFQKEVSNNELMYFELSFFSLKKNPFESLFMKLRKEEEGK